MTTKKIKSTATLLIAFLMCLNMGQIMAQNFVFHAEFVNAWSGPGYLFTNDINGYPSVTVQATSTDDEFIIEADNYYNKWDNYSTCDVNVVTPFVFYGNTPAFDPGNSFLTDSTVVGRYYTTRIQNVGYSSTNVIIMETDSLPVAFASANAVSQIPAANAVPANASVEVTVNLERAKSAQEKVYVRYTIDNWATSQVVEVNFANPQAITGNATIPAHGGGVTVKYYIMTTTYDVSMGVGNYDLITLRQETNAGANYEYTVMMPLVGTAQITFLVNMSNQTISGGVFVAGSFNGFNTTANPMTDIGNGVYAATITVDTNVVLQYKFLNGTQFENGNASCGVDDGFGGYNRFYSVPEVDDTIAVVCFNECTNCALPAFADVTFRVNMSSQIVSPQGVFLAGTFNSFSATADSMIAIGNGVYELTLNLDTTLSVQYKFVNGSIYEAGNAACGVADGLGGFNRVLDVLGANTVLPTVCFNECSNCVTPAFADVTFRVNMSSQIVSSQGVFLAGTFNSFSATADSMIAIGNGVYELTLNLDTTLSVQYKFVNGIIYEAGNAACGVADGLGGFNRVLDVPGANIVLPTVCFNECSDCITVGMSPIGNNNISVYPVPVNDILHIIHNHKGSTNFEVINQIGSIVISGNLLPNTDTINLENLPAGIYFLRLQGESFNAVKRFSKD
ncbi:MAG: T9SS type A sorting domain-containing protein [Bacteroidota bacterium]